MQYKITGTTRLGGLLGSPVSHSLSPAMHNEAFQELGIDFVYLAFDVPEYNLRDVVRSLKEFNTYGFNLTMPDKTEVIEYLDDLSEEAALIGAVNTVVNRNGKLTGYNTDGKGYTESVKERGVRIDGAEVTLLGAGGAARAAAVQLALDGASVLHIANRRSGHSWEAAQRLTDVINSKTHCKADLTALEDRRSLADKISSSALLTNATSAGMSPDTDVSPVNDPDVFHRGLVVSDIIYNPAETKLMRQAEERGCQAFNGMYMLLHQGAAAFRLWTGRNMPVEKIRQKYF